MVRQHRKTRAAASDGDSPCGSLVSLAMLMIHCALTFIEPAARDRRQPNLCKATAERAVLASHPRAACAAERHPRGGGDPMLPTPWIPASGMTRKALWRVLQRLRFQVLQPLARRRRRGRGPVRRRRGGFCLPLHCTEMQAPFLAVWYVLGILIPTGAGALLGSRLLRW